MRVIDEVFKATGHEVTNERHMLEFKWMLLSKGTRLYQMGLGLTTDQLYIMVENFPLVVRQCADVQIYNTASRQWCSDFRKFIDDHHSNNRVPTEDDINQFENDWKLKGPFDFQRHVLIFKNPHAVQAVCADGTSFNAGASRRHQSKPRTLADH